jgi:pimeloyl-ACP methyl ester carboxylesterase
VNYGCQIQDIGSTDITQLIQDVNVPVLFITGQLDQIASPEMSRAVSESMHRAWCAEIAGGTHYCMQECPEIVIDLIEVFFESPHDFVYDSEEVTVHRRGGAPPAG